MTTKITIIIPCYNEINIIEKSISRISNIINNNKLFKIVIVDDGSKDGTREWLQKNIDQYFININYQIIYLENNLGKSQAIQKGIENIEGNYVGLIDADLEYDLNDLIEMYNIINKDNTLDAIFGSRNLGNKLKIRKHKINELAVRINTILFNFLFNQSITDLHSGLKVLKSNVFHNIQLNSKGFEFEIDLSSQMAKNNYVVKEFGISYLGRTKKEGKKITFIDGIKSYYYLLKFYFN
tara:strand:+ start:6842 stop:7555 length:714 start_codon:yes stop_codon:yes gene_type:complete